MTAHVSPDAPRPPSGIRDSGGPMPFNEADFTRDAAELVAEGDRVPTQRQDGCVMTMTLTDFLLTRIAEDEAVARSVVAMNHDERERYAERGGGPDDAETDFDFEGPVDGPSGWAAIYVGPARVLAECEAKRRIVDMFSGNLHEKWDDGHEVAKVADALFRALASVYADHPDYRQEWKP